MTRIAAALAGARAGLEGHSPSARRDAELLLGHVLAVDTTYLFLWSERALDPAEIRAFDALVAQRRAGWPVAYLTGWVGFWTLTLNVSPETLIPRPDTETLVETVLADTAGEKGLVCVDLGTGTGAIALAVASEQPSWQVRGTDFRPEIVSLAQANACRNQVRNARFLVSHWGQALADGSQDIVISNPPYIRTGDAHLTQGDVRFEPASALTAGADGLAAIREVITQARRLLVEGGRLYLEHGYDQAEAVRAELDLGGFSQVQSHPDLTGHVRVTQGLWVSGQR